MNSSNMKTIVENVSKIGDDLATSDKERMQMAVQETVTATDLTKDPLKINKTQQKSLFVAGWRPSIGWIGVMALAYQFIFYPLLTWIWALAQAKGTLPVDLAPPPALQSEMLWVIVSGMLGIGGMRSFDKLKGTDTDRIK